MILTFGIIILLLSYIKCAEVSVSRSVEEKDIWKSGSVEGKLKTHETIISEDNSVERKSEEEHFLEAESVQKKVKDNDRFFTEDTLLVKKRLDCKSKDCKYMHENTNPTNIEGFAKKYKFPKTPPKSYNFLATLSPLTPINESGKLSVKRIGTYPLDEKGSDPSDKTFDKWSVDYKYERVNPDYRIGNEDVEEDNDYPGESNNKKTTSSDSESTPLTTESSEKWNSRYEQLVPEKHQKTVKSILNTNNKGGSGSTLPIIVLTRTDELKFEEKENFYSKPILDSAEKLPKFKEKDTNIKYTKARKPQPYTVIGTNFEVSETSPPMKNQLKNKFRFDRFPKFNSSIQIVPYPVYFTVNPIIRNKKVIIPYPFVVLKPIKKKDIQLKELDYDAKDNKNKTKSTDYFRNAPNIMEKNFMVGPDVEIIYNDDYIVMENDEDYVPATEDYNEGPQITSIHDLETHEDQSKSSTEVIELSSEARLIDPDHTNDHLKPIPTIHSENTSTSTTFIFKFLITRNSSTKYRNPYKSINTIYTEYECSEISRSSFKLKYEILLVILTIISLLC